MQNLNNENGRSMIEMLGVLAIIGVLSVGGIAGYSKAMNKYRINKAIEQITLIAGNVKTFFGPQKNYVGAGCVGNNCDTTNGCQGNSGVDSNDNPTYAYNGCPIIKKAKILPDEMITVNDAGKITAITGAFGYGINIEVMTGAKTFGIIYRAGDNTEACIELLSHDWTSVGANVIRLGDCKYRNQSFKIPVSVDKAVEWCSTFHDYAEGMESYGCPTIGVHFYSDIDLSHVSGLL